MLTISGNNGEPDAMKVASPVREKVNWIVCYRAQSYYLPILRNHECN